METRTDARRSRDDRRFFTGMAIAMMLVVFAGFAPNYYLKPLLHPADGVTASRSIAPLVHVHAVAFSAWMVLFLVQTALVAGGRVNAHRRLGMTAVALVPIMVVLGLTTAIHGARAGWNPGGPYPDALGFLVVGMTDMLIFATFAAIGLYHRRRPGLHKRLMLLATAGGLLWAAITRIPFGAARPVAMFTLFGVLVLALPVRDGWLRSPFRSVSLLGALAILTAFGARGVVGNSTVWRDFAGWLVGP